ncbi:MAG: flippase-like domain-containing protein, partial [Deltaproteobacteria bacterium]
VLAVVIPQIILWFFDALLIQQHMVWFHGPFPLKTFFWVRGAIYILLMINPSLGGGGILLYLKRKTQITWTKLWGLVLFRFGLGMWGMCLVLIPATLAMHHYGLAEKARINMGIWWGLLIFGFAWMVEAWIFWHHKRRFGLSKLVAPNPESEFWTAFRLATRRRWFLTWAMIVPPFLLWLVGWYLLALAFEVRIPFFEYMVISPLVMLIIDLPIAFGGFGTATLAWVTFFGDYGSAENIAALTLFLPFARSICRALIGLVSLKPALQDINSLTLAPGAENEQP